MSTKVTSSHYNNGVTVEFVTHSTPSTSAGAGYDEYTIQIQDQYGEWSRHGGRSNYHANRDRAWSDFLEVCEAKLGTERECRY